MTWLCPRWQGSESRVYSFVSPADKGADFLSLESVLSQPTREKQNSASPHTHHEGRACLSHSALGLLEPLLLTLQSWWLNRDFAKLRSTFGKWTSAPVGVVMPWDLTVAIKQSFYSLWECWLHRHTTAQPPSKWRNVAECHLDALSGLSRLFPERCRT